MGRNLRYRLHEQDCEKYPTLVGLFSAYLHEDAALLSGSLENAIDELIDAALREKTKVYSELTQLISSLESEREAKALFDRHICWSHEGSHKTWFQSLLENMRKAEKAKYVRE